MQDDDFGTADGTIVTDPVEFGNSWKVVSTCENATKVPHPCDVKPGRRPIVQYNCSKLLRPPFSDCSGYINATEEGYIADCEYDMCACEDDPVVCYCQALEAYADDCVSNVAIQWKGLHEFSVCRKFRQSYLVSYSSCLMFAFFLPINVINVCCYSRP